MLLISFQAVPVKNHGGSQFDDLPVGPSSNPAEVWTFSLTLVGVGQSNKK